MKPVIVKLIIISAFFIHLSAPAVFAEPEQKQPSYITKLVELETRMTRIEENQKKILAAQDEVSKKLDTLRVWVRRS